MLIAVFLLSGCSHSIVRRSVERLVWQPVCPVCKAVSISECHCFRGIDGAGYCQTSWASLDPTFGIETYERSGAPVREETPLEELPTPKAAAPPESEALPGSTGESRDVTGKTQLVTQTVVPPAAPAHGPAGGSQAVFFHFADKDAPPADPE